MNAASLLVPSVFILGIVIGALAVHAYPKWDRAVGDFYDRLTGYMP
jgi:hypothetical protein